MYRRFLLKILKRHLEFFPIVLLVGPRQSGKTTLTKLIGEELKMGYQSFDDLAALIAVQLDPIGYIQALKKPLVLDEVQRAPEVFLPIKVDVDSNRDSGRYLLTGSANPLLVPKLGDALTGRMAICNLWPLSQAELYGSDATFIDFVFSDIELERSFTVCAHEELIQKLLVGGFPTLHTTSIEENRRAWCNDYLSLSLQKDINDLSKIESFAHLPALLYGLASRVGSTSNIEELSRITKTSSTSIRRYIQLLENLFLLYRLPPWSSNIDKRLVKSSKIYFSDTALLLHVLDMDKMRLQSNLNVLGRICENFVIMECVKQATWSDTSVKLYYFRHEKERGTEVDLVLETKGTVVGIEVKLSSVVRADDLKGLKSLQQSAGKSFKKGIVLYTGDRVLPLGEALWAVPISALWKITGSS